MAPRTDLAFVLGDNWRRGLRRLGPEHLTRAALLIARQEQLPDATTACDATAWPESRRQRLDAVLRQVSSSEGGAPDLATRDWASLLWSVARCRATLPDPIAQGVVAAVAANGALASGAALQPSDAARLLWAAATLRWRDQAFLHGAVIGARAALPECSPQDLSNMVWASAVLRGDNIEDFAFEAAEAFARRYGGNATSSSTSSSTASQLPPPPPQAVANVLWALAKVNDAHEGSSASQGARASGARLAVLLAPAAVASLQTATPQGVANMLWAYARLEAREESFIEAACHRMAAALAEAEPQHIANATWAVAKLTGTPSSPSSSSSSAEALATAATSGASPAVEALLIAVSSHLHERVRGGVGGGQWLRRWAGCSTRHVSMLCWGFARAMPRHQSTRKVLRDALEQAEELSDQGGLKAQEHANILWAWAEGLDAWAPSERPTKILKRLILMLCSPNLKLLEDSALAMVMSCGALAKLHRVVETASQQFIEKWFERTSRRCIQARVLSQLKSSEIIALLRAMTATKVLHAVFLHAALRELRGDGCNSRLQTFEFVPVMDAAAFVRPETVPVALADLLGEAVSRLHEFEPRDLAAFLWALLRLSHSSAASRLDFDAVFVASTQALAQRGLRLPASGLGGRQCAAAHPETAGAFVAQSALSAREWVWVMNTIAPLRVSGEAGAEAPEWILERFVRPWEAWLRSFSDEAADEVAGLSSARAATSADSAAAARWRYEALLQREGIDSLGPRWTPTTLSRVGIDYIGTGEVPEVALQTLREQREQRSDGGRFGRFAWLRAHFSDDTCENGEPTGQEEILDFAWDGEAPLENLDEGVAAMDIAECDASSSVSSRSPLVAVPLAGRSREGHAEFKLLERLVARLVAAEKKGSLVGDVFIYTDRAPCLSCIGALAQLCRRWPGLTAKVSFEKGPTEALHAARPVAQRLREESPTTSMSDSERLEEAMRLALQEYLVDKESFTPISVVASNPRVQLSWASVCATGVRPSGKSVPGKKREWHDKLKYFLSHRPKAFEVDVGPPAKVRLVSPAQAQDSFVGEGRIGLLTELTSAVDSSIIRLLRIGKAFKGCPVGEGFVSIEEVGGDEKVSKLFRKCRLDAGDRLAYFLRHSEDFDVWAPSRCRPTVGGGDGGPSATTSIDAESNAVREDVRTWVRIRLL